MSEIYIEELNIYPVKSCAPISGDSFGITEKGFAYDREWVITRPNGTFISQRTNPELALIQTNIQDDRLVLKAPIVGELAIPLARKSSEETQIEIFKKAGTGTDEGNVVANYLSDYIGKPVRLFRNQQPRLIKEECRKEDATTAVGFADGFQVLLASTESLKELNKHSDQEIDMARFRANMIVSGELEAYDEDYWRKLTIAKNVGFQVVRACARCPMPNINQATAEFPKPAERFVSAALKESRTGIDPLNGGYEIFFGQNLSPDLDSIGKTISVGDRVYIDVADESRNFLPANG